MLLNHDLKESDLFTIYYLVDKILSGYSIKIIVGNGFSKLIKILKLFGMYLEYYYCIDDNSILYVDMCEFINSNEKCCIIMFPEGKITRFSTPKNLNPNIKNCKEFNIIENNCFDYKKGAFVMSLLFKIPIVQTIIYNSCPNFHYNYFNKKYYIKHINHRGSIIYKYITHNKHRIYSKIKIPNIINAENIEKFITNNSIPIEKLRKVYQKKFISRYIRSLKNAHKNNKYFI